MKLFSASNDNDSRIGAPDFRFFARIINLIANESALTHCAAPSAIDTLCAVGKHFSKSAKSRSALKKVLQVGAEVALAHKLDALQFKNDVATR